MERLEQRLPLTDYSSTDVPIDIEDAGTITSTLTVPDAFVLTDVNVTLNITHTLDSELEVFLVAPDGTAVELFSEVGEDGDNFTGTVLDDEAATPIVFGAAPFTGSFAPFDALAVLDGKNAQGTWTLRVTDSSFFNPGTLTGWSVSLTPAPSEKISPQRLGVSPGVSWFQVDGKTSSFGGEDVYAVDLTAGQRISAAVRTPEFGGFRSGNGAEVLIPDNQTPVTAEIMVNEPFTISDFDVQVLIDHSFDADLDIFLIAPDGRRIELSTDNGDSGDVYLNTIFDDEAPVIISDPSAQAPLAGRWRPESALSVLDGTSSMGRWRLELTDDNPGEEGTLLGWALALNSGIDSRIRIFGPQGELAANDDAVPPVFDSAIVNAVVPATGTYFIQVSSADNNRGAYRLEAGIYDASVTSETGDSTNLDPLRAANNGNAAVLGVADGLGQSDVFTTMLNAGESVLVAATTPGGFFDPRIRITGPGNFSVTDDDSGPGFDSVLRFRAPESGAYTITLDYPSNAEFLDAISTGSYALTVAMIDNASNDDLAGARPISVFDYREPVRTTSPQYGVPGFEGVWNGEISSTTDVDHFSLGRLTANELIGIRAVRLGASQLFANAVLVNSANEIITTSDTVRQGSPLGGTSFEFVIPSTDTYYVRILPDTTEEGGATVSTGAYSLFYSAFGVVVPLGTNGDDVLRLRASANGSMLEIFNADPATNPPIRTWPMNQVAALQIDTLDGNDQVIVQLPSGTNGPTGGIQFNAGGGNNTLLIQSGNIAIDSAAAAGGTLNTTVADAAQLTTRRLNQNGLTLGANGRVTIVAGGTQASVIAALDLGTTGILDLTNNDLVIRTTAGDKAAVFGTLYGRLASGFASGGWNGPGLVSATAAGNPDTTISLVDNAILGRSEFAGVPVDENSILFKYTYYGDIDQNGAVDADDLTVFANNFGRTSGANQVDGDIDFNGTVDADDLTVFANNFGRGAGMPLAASGVEKLRVQAIDSHDLLFASLGIDGEFERQRRRKPSR